MKKLLSLTLSSFLGLGCAHWIIPVKVEKDYKPKRVVEVINEYFDKGMKEISRYTIVKDKGDFFYIKNRVLVDGCDVCEKKGGKHIISYDVYFPKDKQKTNAVIVTPILVESPIERKIADHICEIGYASVLVRRKHNLLSKHEEIENLRDVIKGRVNELKFVVDDVCVNNDPEDKIYDDKAGCTGVSAGSFEVISLAALDERLKVVIPILTGSNLPDIIINSKEEGVEKYKAAMIDKYKITDGQLKSKLKELLFIGECNGEELYCDPITFGKYLDKKKVFLVLGKNDECVPYKNGLELYEILNKPELLLLNTGHYGAFVKYFTIKDFITSSLEKGFKNKN